MPISVAIVGSGPAAFYTAEALVNSSKDVSIDFIERLPTPFGLIRGGVAPDHQNTKNVTKKYEKTAINDQVRFFGNVNVGRDVSLVELREIYDAVVLATGAPRDRKLGIPGEDKAGVFGSADFVGWYNGHPDFRDLNPDLNVSTAAVIGVGNVALDVARLLIREKEELVKADIADHAEKAILESPIKDVYILGRRGLVEAKFTNVEIKEMGKLAACVPQVKPDQLPDGIGDLPDREKRLKTRNLEAFLEYSKRLPNEKPKRVHFEFYAQPVEILGNDRVEGIRLERTIVEEGRAVGTGEFFEIECGLVVAAIGYLSEPLEGAPFDEKGGIIPNDDGRVDDGLYAAGWIKRGPSGVISSNRPDGVATAQHIQKDFAQGAKPGRTALEKLLKERNVRSVSFADWQKIDAAEINNAEGERPRRKFTTVADMLDILDR
ncbi:MAG: FAD-dependent oxidoreductase [Rhodospirillales bacterium]|nr:FAD-dependent oxidoreductase [Rhodospirillales bacterium]